MTLARLSAIAGAAVVAYLGYLYVAFRSADEEADQRTYRRQFTKVMLAGLFGSYAVGVLFPGSGGWPADVGQSIGQIVGSSQPSIPASSEVSGIEIVFRWLKIVGLVVYTVVWLSASFSAQFVVKIYRTIFG